MQFLKARKLILVIPSCITIVFSFVQLSNALLPITVALSGTTNVSIAVMENMLSYISLMTPAGNFTVVRAVHPEKVSPSISVTVSGISNDVINVQPDMTPPLIFVTVLGMVKTFSDIQLENAPMISVTPSGSMRYESESEGASLFRGGTMSSVCVYPQVLHSYTVCPVCEVGPFTVIVYL